MKLRNFGLFLCAFYLVASIAFFTIPGAPTALTREDHLLENTTVALYLLAGGIAFFTLVRRRFGSKTLPFIFLGLSLFATAEELSYGERFIGFEAFHIYGIKFDSLHDSFDIAFEVVKDLIQAGFFGVLFLLLLALLAGFLCLVFRHAMIQALITSLRHQAIIYVMLFFVFGGLGICFDLIAKTLRNWGFAFHVWGTLLEELFETTASIALVIGAIILLREKLARTEV